MLDNLIKSLTNKELETYFRKSRDLWYKTRKFVSKNKNKSQNELNNLLKLSKTLDGYTGYKFSIAPNVNIFLTVEDNTGGLIHNNIYYKNGYVNFDLIIPTVIPHNKEELTSGKKNILQIFEDQYTTIIPESMYIHEFMHYYQAKEIYNFEEWQYLVSNYTGFAHENNRDEKYAYYNNELEIYAYLIEILYEYKHDKAFRTIMDKYKITRDYDNLYKEFSNTSAFKSNTFCIVYSRIFYYFYNEILDLIFNTIEELEY